MGKELAMMGRGGGLLEALPWVAFLVLGTAISLAAADQETTVLGTIAFATLGRAHFAYDLFGLKLPDFWAKDNISGILSAKVLDEIRLTDGVSINYDGQLVEGEARSAVLERFRSEGVNVGNESSVLIFVSERDGSLRVYFQIFSSEIQTTGKSELILNPILGQDPRRREVLENEFSKTRSVVLDAGLHSDGPALFDRASVVGDNIVYVSTKEPRQSPRQSSAAVYSTNLKTQTTTRLTPEGSADFSPAVSPSGEWVAATSSESGYQGEVKELLSDLYIYKAKDGSNRRLVMKHAGWPSWADDDTIFFHRQADDGWWSVFRIIFPEHFFSTGEGEVQEERITPSGVHAITPAASQTGNWVAVATRRPGSKFRHVEIFDLFSHSFIKLTETISPHTNHYNPFVSSYSGFVGYHRCRGNSRGRQIVPLVQEVRSPIPGLALVRVDGTFLSYSPDGSLLAFVRNFGDTTSELLDTDSGVFVSNSNGSGVRQVFSGLAFCPAWDRNRKGVLYASIGPEFSFNQPVQIISLHNVDGSGEVSWKQLTKSGNNAFPSPSPDGKYLVFRSMRSGYKNLYIMDAVDGEEKYLRRLTEGPWTDQHPNWSPDGEWIAFISNREHPDIFSFSIYLIRPDGTGLHKVLQSNHAGLTVHPIFSPDSKKLVFVSDLAAVSGEPVAEPFMFQPYGEVFIAEVDGSNIKRLTHDTSEDGTPAWSPSFLSSSDLSTEGRTLDCNVEDTRWLKSDHSYQHYSHKLPPIRC